MTESGLELWTVYQRPKDYPEGYVVRRSVVGGGRPPCPQCLADVPHGTPAQPCLAADRVAQYAPDLASARALVPRWLHRLPRAPDDDPAILEVWL